MSRKPRSDSKLLNLAEEDQVKIFDWLRSVGYEKTKLLVAEKLEVSTSVGALHNFYEHRFEEHQRLRFMKAASAAKVIEAEAEQDFSPQLAQLFGQMAFEAGVDERPVVAESYLKMARAVKSDMMRKERFEFEIQKFRESMKTKQEAALDALFDDISGNAEAEKLFAKMRAVLTAATEAAANG